jgi:hypothetical protein
MKENTVSFAPKRRNPTSNTYIKYGLFRRLASNIKMDGIECQRNSAIDSE